MDPKLSRGLWLVKWLLLVPHAIVLAFLWVAFFAVSLFAMFAILFTGRYPRALFDFNVGVLRWTWRVGFYAFNANGTDRYPPFTLRDVDYPATFSVEYPGELSRGLALVKWWLLAIPHYVIVALFIGGIWYGTHWGGAIAVLVLIAVLALLFTGRYPQGIFDLVLGMNRWALRVAAYAGLMTDVYPPFRLDMGAMEPGVAVPAVRAPKAGSSPGGVLMAVFGSLGFLVALGLLSASAALVWVDQTQRDSAGFVMAPSERLATSSYAVTAGYQRTGDALEARSLAVDVHGPSWMYASDRLGTVRIHVESQNGHPLFVGIAPTTAVAGYLGSVDRAALTGFPNGNARYVTHTGAAPSGPPAAQSFWARTASGRGDIALTWPVRHGAWTVVVMNADASRGVVADARLGARLGFLGELAGGIAVFALVSGAFATWLALAGIRRVNRASEAV
ncbi:MAG TPA: DUF4389 domain-containing protein [Gaiellales bacterium]|nr:DUF4389 domain-containing protein [Gaiellales bacterium]